MYLKIFFSCKFPDKCVKEADGVIMAEKIGAFAYVECSALSKENVRCKSFEIALLK